MLLKNVYKAPVLRVAIKIACFIFIIWAANIAYGFVHESGHAAVVEALGGQVYELYVNPLGTNAYTMHSDISGIDGQIALEVAGMAMTTLLAFISLFTGYAPLTWFLTLRTSIYALNYAPGTDIYNIQQSIGSGSWLISALLIAMNLTCALMALKMSFTKTAGDAEASASSAHALRSNNN
jgi:hypothetical protein